MAFCSMPKVEPFARLNGNDFSFLNSERNLSNKMYAMADMLAITENEQYERERIVSDIFNLLRPYYPECDILIFGSSANGFGFRGCDLDLLFLPFPEYCNLDFKFEGSAVVPHPYEVLNGTVSKNQLYQMDEEMHLTFVQRIIYTSKQNFKKVFFIPAKCPILSIEFHDNPLQCDFSASNRFVLYNTQLMWVYGRLDPRVRALVMFLRYWAKSIGFIAKSRFSSYSLTLLVIFYLQNTDPPILPSVRYLNELADYTRIIDGWETAICLDKVYINANRHENSSSLAELLENFFDFYWNFDFVQNIVSVHDGKPLPVKLVKECKNERIRTFQVTPLSIQDPLILSRNVSRNAVMKTPFKLSLVIANDLLKRQYKFKSLFDSRYYQNEMNKMFSSTRERLPANPTFLVLQLTYEIHKKLALTSQLKPWFDKVSQGVLDILQYGLLIDCEVVDKVILDDETVEPPTKKRKHSCVDLYGDLRLVTSIQCTANFPTLWKRNRVEVLEHLKETSANFEVEDSEVEIPASLKTEYKISKELSKDEIKNVTKLPEIVPPYISFICDCYQYPEPQISDIVICFSPLSLTNRKAYNETKEFVKMFVRKHIKCIFEED